ncbi:hypothetical protein DVS28_b0004 (plasmid) [Euzebya pacifica]|uniref:Uncharacterized protein n=1 Tax=Euzebya pacifica TaxID=1608957 RepID=A0A346Y5M7_9ACTN|nr:hypothetical protein DVS28_b0004 [Euzebya pacifica]
MTQGIAGGAAVVADFDDAGLLRATLDDGCDRRSVWRTDTCASVGPVGAELVGDTVFVMTEGGIPWSLLEVRAAVAGCWPDCSAGRSRLPDGARHR